LMFASNESTRVKTKITKKIPMVMPITDKNERSLLLNSD
jgi:hypothetical protein